MNIRFCKTCGATLVQKDEYTWACGYCQNIYSEKSVKEESEKLLRTLIDEEKLERVANLRRNLYDAINAQYTDSEEICRICSEIKALLPDDFMANFYYIANHDTPKAICEAIRSVDAVENINYVDGIVKHIVKSMRSEYALPLQNLVERAYKNTDMQKFVQLSTEIADETEKVASGTYDTALPRDVFVAYSSKDMNAVEELVGYLEYNCLECFVAARNLRHGRGAVQNYENALHEAMDNCKYIVFVSSVNSRNTECDALRVELSYIKTQDRNNCPAEYKQQDYENIPYKFKKKRIEYRIDNTPSPARAEKILKQFFYGLEYAGTPEMVIDAIDSYVDNIAKVSSDAPTAPAFKYCKVCGTENPSSMKFCGECGGREFVDTYKEYELTKKLADMMKAEKEREASKKETEKAHKPTETHQSPKGSAETDSSYFNFNLLGNGTYSATLNSNYKYTCPEKVVLPSSHKGIPVTSIGKDAFSLSHVHNIIIHDSITRIGSSAFSGSFLESITIPDSVTEIGNSAFYNNTRLKTVSLPAAITKIGAYVFSNCGLAKITIPKGVTSIGEGAFDRCYNLKSITIPNSVTYIGKNAFFGCTSLSTIAFDGTKEEWENIKKGNLYDPNRTTVSFTKKSEGETSDSIFEFTPTGNTYIVSVKDKSNCHGHITIPSVHNGKKVVAIANNAFEDCNALTSVSIPDSVTYIGDSSFAGCSSLTHINIPSGVSYMGREAFKGCSSLRGISIPYGITSINMSAFCGCSALTSVLIPSGVTTIENSAFYSCSSLTSVTIPNSVTAIDAYAFKYCSSLASIQLPSSVTNIGYEAFSCCTSLTGILFQGGRLAWWKIKKGEDAIPQSTKILFQK